jgi:hypothetical protein
MIKNAKKTPNYKNKKFICEVCSFGCNKKSDFIRHNSTYKHINATELIKKRRSNFYVNFVEKVLSINRLFSDIKKSVKIMMVS